MLAENRQKVSDLMTEVVQLRFANDLNLDVLKVADDEKHRDDIESSITENTVNIEEKRKQINYLLLELPV